MTTRDLSIETARTALQELTEESRKAGLTPTASALAKRLGLKRPTLYAKFPELIVELNAERASNGAQLKGRPRDAVIGDLRNTITLATRTRKDMEHQLATYAEQIRRLTIENIELRQELEASQNVTSIVGRSRRTSG